MTNTIKCPQCGAARIEKVSRNKCSCPYCGNVFYVEADSEFVKQETDGLKLSQKIEREEFKRSLKQKKKNLFIFWEIGIILFVPLVALLSWVIVMIANYFSDKYIDFSCEYEKISFLHHSVQVHPDQLTHCACLPSYQDSILPASWCANRVPPDRCRHRRPLWRFPGSDPCPG